MRTLALLAVYGMAACSHPIQVVSKNDTAVLDGYLLGACSIGCGWRFRSDDEEQCSGFSTGVPVVGKPFSVSVYCGEKVIYGSIIPNLVVENVEQNGPSAAVYNGEPVLVNFK